MAAVNLGYTLAFLDPPDNSLWWEIKTYLEDVQRNGDHTSSFVVHGDFWTGNVLITPTSTGDLGMKVVDWEASNCRHVLWNDLGQMCSEMYQPVVFGHIPEAKGRMLISSLLSGYQEIRKPTQEEVRSTTVRYGIHMMVWPGRSGWGDKVRVESCKAMGREYADKGWKCDWSWLRHSVFGVLVCESW
jgi:Ser/Thr protein kinase RdoA (MazF antagonist)